MDSDDDFELFAPTGQPSPVPQRKLKRLKKAVRVSTDPVRSPSSDDAPLTSDVRLSPPQSPNLEKSNEDLLGLGLGSEDENELNFGSGESDSESEKSDDLVPFGSESEGFGNENELTSGFDGLGGEGDRVRAKRVLEFDSVVEEEDGKGEERSGEVEEENREPMAEGSEKKRHSFEELDGEKENQKKKKRRPNSTEDDEMWNSFGPAAKMTAKERREHLKQLHADSQRLLRETRDASFKPVPLVQKSISSVLEKIRKRKVEISKKSVSLENDFLIADDNGSRGEAKVDSDPEGAPSCEQEDVRTEEIVVEETMVKHVETNHTLEPFDVLPVDGLDESANHSSQVDIPNQMDVDNETKQAFRAPIDDTQELFSDSQDSDTNKQQSSEPNSPAEEVFAPSLLAMNLKLDSAFPDDATDDEEENDKENIHPQLHIPSELSSSPRGDPVKAFVDDEAVEEDDSDDDHLLFQENEDDEDNGDSEELNDIIATGFKEKPIDSEIRNQLHQKWLEQQDAMGTENLLQRLKYGSKEPQAQLLEEDDDSDGDGNDDKEGEENEEPDDETEDLAPIDLIRATLKKVKQMIPLMFTDKEDPYISSDDEETEKRLVKQCLHARTEEKAVFLSPAEDAGSKEVFGLIKKTNVLPDPKKKSKSSNPFGMPHVQGNRSSSSKSSFIGRGANGSVPSSHKQGSKVRSFIFGREDSNSKTAISEDSSDMIQREKVPGRAPAKFSGSQCKSSTQNTKTAAETTNSGTSLFEILRRSSLQPNKRSESTMFTQNESIFASFRLPKKPVK